MQNPRLIDLSGRQFGLLTVVRKAGNMPGGAAIWLCRCACGAETRPTGTDLRLGKATRCKGCRASETFTTHGQSGTRLHRIWKQMRARCADKTNPHYGARGIAVCREWSRFKPFMEWALANGYSDELSIERLDNYLGYYPLNCTWTNSTEQSRNRRFVRKRRDGKPWSLVAKENGITDSAYRTRLGDGWTHDEAATWPMFKRRPGKEHKRNGSGRFAFVGAKVG